MLFLKNLFTPDIAVFASADHACINRLELLLLSRNFKCYTDSSCYPVCVVKCPASCAAEAKKWICDTGFTCEKAAEGERNEVF